MYTLRYQAHIFSKTIKIDNLIDKIDNKRNLTGKTFSNSDEFKEYINERVFFTKRFYIISWCFSTITLISSLITMFILRY